MKRTALLIGNGMNRAIDNKAWSDVLSSIRTKHGIESHGQCSNLPLEFERIYLESKAADKIQKAYAIKQEVANFLPSIDDYSLHKNYVSLPIEHIITTNYDYSLEQALSFGFSRRNHSANTAERRYSLLRRIRLLNKSIWHIHGEIHCPDSICLGYDHYCTYLAKIVALITQPNHSISKQPTLRYYLENGFANDIPWPYLFFTHNICIVGLNLSYSEIDLWWLLSYRRRFILENPQYSINNKIFYYYPVYCDGMNDEQCALLQSMGIILKPIPLPRKNWRKLYIDILEDIQGII